jgi:tRNA pseudouridine55 synthase
MKQPSDWDGLLVLDKPSCMTSRAALDRAARWFPRRTRLGHTGTLDPLATGVLVLCLGQATRLAEYVQRMAKTYRTRLQLGARSDTDDADGTITLVEAAQAPEAAAVAEAVAGLVGEIEQVPPGYSAAKVAGRRAYDLARQGKEVVLASRRVCVHGIDVLAYEYPHLDLEIRCGKGTYVRSLARDLGDRLGCGALVQTLRRLRVGPFTVDDAMTLETDVATVRSRLLPPAVAVADLPSVALAAAELEKMRHGQAVPVRSEGLISGPEVAVFNEAGRLKAVARMDVCRGLLFPEKVLAEG